MTTLRLSGRHGQSYELGSKIGSGGEGTVYAITGRSDLVAKLYDGPSLTGRDRAARLAAKRAKIEAMLSMRVDITGRTADGSSVNVVAWPQDLLLDANGQFVGITMPCLPAGHSITAAARPQLREKTWPGWSWASSVGIAFNLASAVDKMHAYGVVIGDLNSANLLLDGKGYVQLVDCDSYDITDPRTGVRHQCMVGRDELMPPELQGRRRSLPSTVFTRQSDDFGLAVHIFELLMNNVHPFGVPQHKLGRTASTSQSSMMENITNGLYPYARACDGGSALQRSKAAPDPACLPPYLRDLFDRAFAYTARDAAKQATIARRPAAQEWVQALGRLSGELCTCPRDASHRYWKGATCCPWCALKGVSTPTAAPQAARPLPGTQAAVSTRPAIAPATPKQIAAARQANSPQATEPGRGRFQAAAASVHTSQPPASKQAGGLPDARHSLRNFLGTLGRAALLIAGVVLACACVQWFKMSTPSASDVYGGAILAVMSASLLVLGILGP